MCGIGGLSWADAQLCRRMMAAAAHRGPDQDGVFAAPGATLGHKRLSIIDLSDGGRQPMADPDNTHVITFNGEIYNYVSLKRELEAQGVRFHSSSDTEVLLQGLRHEGIAFLRKLHGIFAFALLATRTGRLILARDAMGVKPLYYTVTSEGLAFASEIKQLLELPNVGRQISVEAIERYLMFHYVGGDLTMVEGIRRLPPGGVLTWENGTLAISSFGSPILAQPTTGDAVVTLERLLQAAIREQMVADVPVGSFLSGGVDSGIVTALAQDVADEPLSTFSVGFGEGLPNELREARETAEALGTNHYEVTVRGDEVRRNFDKLAWHHDEPLGEPGAIPNYYVAREASRCVKVVLAGEGGDEIFGGYPWYPRMDRVALLRRIVPGKPLLRLLTGAAKSDFARRIRTIVQPTSDIEAYARLIATAEPLTLERVYGRSFSSDAIAPLRDAHAKAESIPGRARWQAVDIQTLLAECYLMKADRMTMAWSVEERVPLLAPAVARFGIGLTRRQAGEDKALLRQVARRHLPAATADRPKRGYSVPIVAWTRGPLREDVERSLASSRLAEAGILSRHGIDRLAARLPMSGHEATLAWLIFALERWVDVFRIEVPRARARTL